MELNLDWLVQPGVTVAILGGMGYIFRESILRVLGERVAHSSKQVLQDRQHQFDIRLEQIRQDFERFSSKQAQIWSSVLDVSSDRAKEVSKREIEAAEAIWSSANKLGELLPTAQLADVLNFEEIESSPSRDREKYQNLADMLTKSFTPQYMSEVSCDWARLFVNESAWAFYTAYLQIIIVGASRMKVLAIGSHLKKVEVQAGLKKAILEALPHQKQTFDEFPDINGTLFLEELKQALVIELKRSIQGEQSSSAELQKAKAILNALAEEPSHNDRLSSVT